MSQDESNQNRQTAEFEVLESIFGDELKDLNQIKQNKEWHPLHLSITLTPQKGMSGSAEVYAQVDLHVICDEQYPKKVPKIKLKNSKGLSDLQIANHLIELQKMAENLKGEVMIFELCQYTQKFLHEHNQPRLSFYEEMILREQCELKKKQLIEKQKLQLLRDEILKRQEEYECHNSSLNFIESNTSAQVSPVCYPIERIRTSSRRRNTSSSESSDSLCEHRGTKILSFDNKQTERKVNRGKCLGHNLKNCIVYAGVDNTTGELLAVNEWTLKCSSSGNSDNGEATNLQNIMKQIASIEQELNKLNKLRHQNLVPYLNMKYSQEKDIIKIFILQEFVVGTTCSFYLLDNIPCDILMLRHLATGVLSALSYLHENDVVHKNLRDNSIHIDRSGVVKVADYSLDKRLSDIYGSNCSAKAENDLPITQGRVGKKTDIFKFGLLLLSLIKGEIVLESDLLKEINLPAKPDLRDFLNKCLVVNERTRWTADQLLEHCFIKIAPDRVIAPSNDQEKHIVEAEEEPDADINFNLPSLGGSRIQSEFEILKWLGKGAFGDVLKVKNKLDGCIYAIKRIKLNPKNKQLNKKITREVKLLSRLNHDNVVRYYNSWIERATFKENQEHNRLTPSDTPSIHATSEDKTSCLNVNSESKIVENLLSLPQHDVGWNVTNESQVSPISCNSREDNENQSSDDSDSDEEWSYVPKIQVDDSSNSIEFERNSVSQTSENIQNSKESLIAKNGNGTEKNESVVKEIQYMYIQMEFCEKSTLRTAIDKGLFEDEERIWRLFREIIEGLAHIHQQAMIHRDLKPVNIFLDSNDHVKIGDFGLATTNILSNFTHILDAEKESQINEKGANSEMDYAGSLTGQVGTALYVAPELSTKVDKAIYNQKVDIYSLGIIFFEMCHRPLATGMERAKILVNLRSKDIILPLEMDDAFGSNKIRILRWLLNHDPRQRPTSQELLASDLLPPPELEQKELQDMVRRTLANVESKPYKYLINCCLTQDNTTIATDLTYEMNLSARNIDPKFRLFRELVQSKIIEIFKKHGGMLISTPLLMPKSDPLYNSIDSHVRLMTRSGSVVSIPYDLHAPFARYVALNSISNIRRYTIERVYKETKAYGFHPREMLECAFDIISSTVNSFMPEAELISITSEILREIPIIQDREITVRINHTSLLQAVLIHCGIEPEKYQDIYSIMRDVFEENLSRLQIRTRLISLCLTDHSMEILFDFFDSKNTITKIPNILRSIAKRKGDAAAFAKKGLKEVETVIAHAQVLGVKWPINIVPLLVSNTQLYSGIFYQVTCELKRRRRHGSQDVIAAGGRYDKLLWSFRQTLERTCLDAGKKKPYGVGISISLDNIISISSELDEDFFYENKCPVDVAVCCIDDQSKCVTSLGEILNNLWSLGFKVIHLDLKDPSEIFEYCNLNMINNLIMLNSDEIGTIKIHTKEKGVFRERKINAQDLAEYFQKYVESTISVTNNKTERVSYNVESNMTANIPANLNINFVLSEKDKLSGSMKKNFKNQMLAQMSSHLLRISHKVSIEVFAIFLEISVIRTIANFLELDVVDKQDFERSVYLIIEKYPRHKKYVKKICDEMRESRSDKSRPVLILYSLTDSRYVTLM